MDKHCGEIICADTVHLEAECPELYGAPNFGSFVRVDSEGLDIYGVVYHISTGCIDANRKTQALGLAADEIVQKMPHLDLVLRTTFAARVVGFRVEGAYYPYLPAQPARLHRFIAPAADEEIRVLTRPTMFLRTLAMAPELPVEDVVASALRHAYDAWNRKSAPEAEEQLLLWGKYLARLFRNDYDRFEAIWQRVPPAALTSAPRWEEPLPLSSPGRDPFE